MRIQTLLVFLMVVASASASSFIVGQHVPARRATDIPTRQEVIDAMADEVGLDQEQRRKVREIQDGYHDRLLALQRSVDPEIADIRSQVRAKTREILTGEQQHRFDLYCARRDRQRAAADQ